MSVAREARTVAAALGRFRDLDWTFPKSKANDGIHGVHPYPAKFIPQIPGKLLDLFHEAVGGAVLDPFCGSGTTLVECRRRGIESVGVDLNPIATLVSRVKTRTSTVNVGGTAELLVDRAAASDVPELPSIPRLLHWFTEEVARALARLTKVIEDVEDLVEREALQLALSRVIVRVSRQESETRYAAVDVNISEKEVLDAFLKSAHSLDKVLADEAAHLFHGRARCDVLTRNILEIRPEDLPHDFGMVITSPPYPNAYEYWLYHKYRMYWLGEDPIKVRRAEIGARPKYHGSNPATAEDFRCEMSRCFALFARIVRPAALVCILVGRSVIRGQHVDNAALVQQAAGEHGFSLLTSAKRQIPTTRKTFNPAHGSINDETLLVLSRGIG